MENTKNKGTQGVSALGVQWRRHLEAWRVSGTTQVRYCRDHGLSRHAFQYWKHRLQEGSSSRFVEIPRPSLLSGGTIEILVNEHLQIRVPEGVGAEHLRRVLQAVVEL